ncbi:UNVERIFIED_CONTAM: hypothetical protein RMT77_016322 [Armadillidium vulgare]
MNEKYRNEYGLLEKGAKLIILGLPEGSEFGIDLQGWTIGNKFKGLKMIPPGFHFYYISIANKYGDLAPRIGCCHYFHEEEILVKKYNPDEEDISDGSKEVIASIKKTFNEIDAGLGPFPFECWTKWVSLTHHISHQELERLVSGKDKIHTMLELINEENIENSDSLDEDLLNHRNCGSNVDEELPCFPEKKSKNNVSQLKNKTPFPMRSGMEIKFCEFPSKPYRDGASPSEISKGSIDSSYTMSYLLQQLISSTELLSEVQFSFVCFLVGQDWDSWEHWRKLILAFCCAEETLIENSDLYFKFLSIFHFQIQEVPEDLFVDIVEGKNFLVVALRTLFANIFDNKTLLPKNLISKAKKFQKHLVSKFRWDLNLIDEEENLPVIVEI